MTWCPTTSVESVKSGRSVLISMGALDCAAHTETPHAQSVSVRKSARRRGTLEIEPRFAHYLPSKDVAEDVLLDLLVREVDHLDARDHFLAQPLHAERAVEERVGIGRAREARIEHVLPERLTRVTHRQVAEIPAVVRAEPDVEAILRRPVEIVDRDPRGQV